MFFCPRFPYPAVHYCNKTLFTPDTILLPLNHFFLKIHVTKYLVDRYYSEDGWSRNFVPIARRSAIGKTATGTRRGTNVIMLIPTQDVDHPIISLVGIAAVTIITYVCRFVHFNYVSGCWSLVFRGYHENKSCYVKWKK